jgi:beta-glucosidase-like glycosyl hydrolase/CubicO group peptidase (beta-lactamase class C family)
VKSPLRFLSLALALGVSLSGCGGSPQTESDSASSIPAAPLAAGWVDSLMRSLSLEEKAGQLIGVLSTGHYVSVESDEYLTLLHAVRENRVGAFVIPQGDVYETALLLNRLQREARVPLLVTADLERGLAMRVRRGTYFPDAMAIGATRTPAHAYAVGRAIAREARALGVHQNFAPVADINTNPSNPVINTRAFSDDRDLVAEMVRAFVRGTEDGGLIATAKHFPGHGETGTDSHLELPFVRLTRARMDTFELVPFRAAIDAGVSAVMVGHLAVPALEEGSREPASLSPGIIVSLLTREMGFSGLVVSDAMEMRGVVQGYSTAESTVKALQAGTDIVLLPPDVDVAVGAVVAAVKSGALDRGAFEASVRKVLAAKERLGLAARREVDLEAIAGAVGTRAHAALARQVARDAVTLLKNDADLLPLPPASAQKVLLVVLADSEESRTDVHRASSAQTSEPAGAYFAQLLRGKLGRVEMLKLHPGSTTQDFETASKRIRLADLVVMGVYSKVRTSSGRIGLPQRLKEFAAQAGNLNRRTVGVVFGNPYLAGSLTGCGAVLCAYSDAEVLVESAVEAMTGGIDVRGRLPVTIPKAFPFGAGLDIPRQVLRREDPAATGFDPVKLRQVDALIKAAIRDSAFPGAQLAIVKDGLLVWNRSYGTYTYDLSSREITASTLFDLASLTKVVATTSCLMVLAQRGEIGLDDRVSAYLPAFAAPPRSEITLRQLLLHRGGFPPFRKLWELCPGPEGALDSVYATPLVAAPGDTTIYSDLGFITLGNVVEKAGGMPLDAFFASNITGTLGMRNTMFRPPAERWLSVAPTEVDTAWRKGLVRGTVHDENAAFLGGVSGHAGLFANATDLALLVSTLLPEDRPGGRRLVSDSVLALFTRTRPEGQDRYYLGWAAKPPRGFSAGDLLSASSFGHTGFTGTSIWVDPERSLAVIFLTNRVHPTRANMKIRKVRPMLHDAVVSSLVAPTPSGGTPPAR